MFQFDLDSHKITYEKTPFPRCPSSERWGRQYHRSRTSLLAAISNHSLVTSPAKMSAFKRHMRQNA